MACGSVIIQIILGGTGRDQGLGKSLAELLAQEAIFWCLSFDLYFEDNRNMDNATATMRLAALAQETRLEIFRALVQAGPAGLNPGVLGEKLGTAQATLSFHLKELKNSGLIQMRQESRFKFYFADFSAMNELLAFLTENCCGGDIAACDLSSNCKENTP